MTNLDTLIDQIERGVWKPTDDEFYNNKYSFDMLGKHSAVNHAYDAYEWSLDAAHSLHNQILPGRGASFNIETGYAAVYGEGIAGKVDTIVKGNVPRAWILSSLKAYRAMQNKINEGEINAIS